MVKVELHQNYGSVYDFAVSRFVPKLITNFHFIHILIAFISGWVKRTIDPVLPPPAPPATTPSVADVDSTAIASSLKIESDSAAPVKDSVSAPGIKGISDAGTV
jgi:hypothetical protein